MEACHGIEQDIRTNKIRSVYKVIRELTEDYAPKVNTVKDKNGKLIKDEKTVKTRWKEYFEELYNDPNPVNESILNELHPSNRETSEEEPPILLDEVQNAIGRLKNRKAPGVDNITAEELQAGTQILGADILHKLFQDVWDAEEFPPDWRKAIIVPIFKKKDKQGL